MYPPIPSPPYIEGDGSKGLIIKSMFNYYDRSHFRKQEDKNLVPLMVMFGAIIVIATLALTYSPDLHTLNTELVKAEALLN